MTKREHSLLVFIIFFIASIPLTLANGSHNEGHEEESSLAHQFQELLPFEHFAEGHLFIGVMLILFWISFFYTIYSIFQMLRKKK